MNKNATAWRTSGLHVGAPVRPTIPTKKTKTPKFPRTFETGQVFERLEHPGAFVRIEKTHKTQGTLTLLDQDGYLRLFPQGWMKGTFKVVELREGRKLFAKVKANGYRRLTEYTVTPARITPEYLAAVKRGISSVDLARGSIAGLAETRRTRVAGTHLAEVEKVSVQRSAAPAHVIEEESGITEARARRALSDFVRS